MSAVTSICDPAAPKPCRARAVNSAREQDARTSEKLPSAYKQQAQDKQCLASEPVRHQPVKQLADTES